MVEDTLPRARPARQRGSEAWLRYLGGEAMRQGTDPDSAAMEGRYRAALLLAGEFSMRPLVAWIRFAVSRLLAERGIALRAGHLADVMEMLDEMAVRSWLQEATPAMSQLD